MGLPFGREQFFEVFAAYNLAVWPVQLLLGGLALAMVAAVLFAPRRAGRLVSLGLALLWAWTALAYHLAFFRAINPAAPVFAVLCLASAAAFAFLGGWRGELRFERARGLRALLGWTMVAYALVGYPLAGALAGHAYPATPTFGLPCPVTLFTLGLLMLAAPGLNRLMVPGPLAWALIGGSAAFLLAVPQDYVLFVAAAFAAFLLRAPGVPAAAR
jgi:hypothetical protein